MRGESRGASARFQASLLVSPKPNMPILYDPSRDEHYIPLPSFPLVRITPARPDDAQRLVEIYNVPSIGKRLYAIPWP